MNSSRIPPLAWALVFACPPALLAQACLPLAALCAAVGWLIAIGSSWPWRRAGLLALPALLAALGTREPTRLAALPAGLLRVQGQVQNVVRAPDLGLLHLDLGSLRLCVQGDAEVLPGDAISVLGYSAPPPVPDWTARIGTDAHNLRVQPSPPSLRRALAALRRQWERTLLAVGGARGALLATLVLGDETRPDRAITDSHRGTGLSHLLAVSGAHAAILAQLLGLSARRAGQRLARARWHLFAVLLLLALYGMVTGGDPPVLRAVLGYGLAALASPMGRRAGLWVVLGAPALLTCCLQPSALLGPSFQLSYAAVLGLALAPRLRPGDGWRKQLLGALLASFWAALATTPLTLFWFGQVAPWTVLLTPLLAPLIAVLLVGGLLCCTMSMLSEPLGHALGWPLRLLAEGYASAIAACDHLPGTPILGACTPTLGMLLLALGFACSLLAWRRNRVTLACALLLLAGPHFVPSAPPQEPGVQVFAVGHGQACLFRQPDGQRIAIDCGSMHHPQLATSRLLDALPERHIDLLVITHADADHHNGVQALLERVAIAQAILPIGLRDSAVAQQLAQRGSALRYLAPGERCAMFGSLHVAAPAVTALASDNDQSLWCRITTHSGDWLLTGDAEALGVATALAEGLATPAAVLVLPHHGRANPLIAPLLARVQPRLCLVSAAVADGLTAQGECARAFGCEVLATGLVGNVGVQGSNELRVQHSQAWRPIPARHFAGLPQ